MLDVAAGVLAAEAVHLQWYIYVSPLSYLTIAFPTIDGQLLAAGIIIDYFILHIALMLQRPFLSYHPCETHNLLVPIIFSSANFLSQNTVITA